MSNMKREFDNQPLQTRILDTLDRLDLAETRCTVDGTNWCAEHLAAARTELVAAYDEANLRSQGRIEKHADVLKELD